MSNDESGFFDTRRAADYLGLLHRTLDGYRVSGDGPPSTASATGCCIAGRIWTRGRRSAGRPRRRKRTGWARDEGADARVSAAQSSPGSAMRYSGQRGPLQQDVPEVHAADAVSAEVRGSHAWFRANSLRAA